MILTETNLSFSLATVKPLESLEPYRKYCLEETNQALSSFKTTRKLSPVGSAPLVEWGRVDGLIYLQCPETGSLFLQDVSNNENWDALLKKVAEKRNAANGFHQGVAGTRASNVYIPKLEWIESAIRLQGLKDVSGIELHSPPSRFSSHLKSSRAFKKNESLGEIPFMEKMKEGTPSYDVAVLFESFDRVNDPKVLADSLSVSLKKGGLVFVTSSVSSGFDQQLLGERNLYFCPPDRTNCFSLSGLRKLLETAGFELLEVSTPGVLDLEVVRAHMKKYPDLKISGFEKTVLDSDEDTSQNFQSFLQKSGLSSFARIIGRKK